MKVPDEQIDKIFDDNSKFIARRAHDKGHYEVIEAMNEDWREILTDDIKVRGTFATGSTAEIFRRRLHVRFVLGMSVEEKSITTAITGERNERSE